MIKEFGEVVRIDGEFIWVQTVRQSTCGACQARHGCGQKLLQQLSSESADIKARLGPGVMLNQLAPGDQVEIGISERAVVVSSMITYGVPIASLVAAIAISAPFKSDAISALSGLAAIVAAALCVRWFFPKLCYAQTFEPIVLGLNKPERSS